MVHKNFNTIINVLLLVCFLTFIVSCEVEEEYVKSTISNYKLRKVKFDEFKSKVKVFEKFKQTPIVNQSSSVERIVYDEQFGIYYDVDNILYIQKDNYESYTIPIIKEPNDSLVKNLVLYQKANEPIKARLMGYKLTEEEIQRIREGQNVDVTNRTYSSVLNTNYDPSYATSSSISWYDDSGCLVTATSTYVPGTLCASGEHSFGQQCDLSGNDRATQSQYIVQYTYGFCLEFGSDGGAVGDIGNPGSPSGGDPGQGTSTQTQTQPSENADEVVTTLVLPGLDEEIQENEPCNSLSNLVNPSKGNIKPYIDSLKYYVNLPQTKIEYGVQFTKRSDPTPGSDGYIYENIFVTGSESTTPLNTAGNNIGGGHTHNSYGHPMYSFGDLMFLRDAYNNASPSKKGDVVYMLVCKDAVTGIISTYAIIVDNISRLNTEISTVWNSPKYAQFVNEKERLAAIHDAQADKYELNKNNLEKYFLQTYGGYGFSIYKSVNENLDDWQKLDLDVNALGQLSVVGTPCN